MTDKKKLAIGLGAIGALLLFVKRAEAEPEPGNIIYSNLKLPQGMQPIDKWVGVYVDVTNTYAKTMSETVVLEGDFSDSKTVSIEAGRTETVVFGAKLTAEGIYNVIINGLSGTILCGTVDVEVIKMTASPQVVYYGENVTITVTVQNRNWLETVSYTVKLTGAITAQENVVLGPHQVLDVVFIEPVNWEGYKYVYCENLSVLIKGEKVYEEPPPPGSFSCPYGDGFTGDSDAEIGIHIAESHFGYGYPTGVMNESSFANLGGMLALYSIIDPNPTLLQRCKWAIQNVISNAYLWMNLTQSQKEDCINYMREVMNMTDAQISALFMNYGSALWQDYIRVDEIAPDWLEGDGDGETPPPERYKLFKGWPQDTPIPEGWYLLEGSEPYQAESGVWYITIWTWVEGTL